MKIVEGEVFVENVKDFISKLPCEATFINSDFVPDVSVVEFAVKKAKKSWKEGRNVAKNLSTEILLYVAATRQIRDALKIGLREGLNRVVVVTDEACLEELKRLGFVEKKVLGELDKEKVKRLMKLYNITEEELKVVGVEKIPLLVRERIALFDLVK